MKTYFRLLSFAKPIEKYAIPYIIFTIITVIFGTLNLALLAPLLQVLFKGTDKGLEPQVLPQKPDSFFDLPEWFTYYADHMYSQFGAYDALKYVCIGIITSVFISNLFRYFSQRVMENFRINTLLNMRRVVYDRVMDMHLGFFSNQRKGDIMSKISSDVQVVQYSVTSTLQVAFKEPLQLIAYVYFLFAISTKLTLFALAVIPISAFIISKIVKTLKAQAIEGQNSYGRMISYLDESLSGIRIIKAFNAENFVKKRFQDENTHYSKIMRRMVRRQQLGSPVSELLGVLMVAIILLYGGNLVLTGQGELKASEFITYIALFSQVMRPAKALTESFANIHQGLAAGERVLDLIDEKNQIEDKPNAVVLQSFTNAINFENVNFSYSSKEILSNINLSIKKGETVALVGPSGGGKSTLVDLIPRFMDPKSGTVSFDGQDLKDVNQQSLRNLIGVVNQESILFNDTVFNNITFGAEHATEEQVMAAAKIANAHEFIVKLEDGYQTNIGDRGMKLSGGQRQRICIARAVLKNPPIMLLDEATSALDTESERLVQDSLYKLMENRTTVVIAHRLSTIQNADKIIVIESGRIAEMGSHRELMNQHGLYKRLIDMQQFTEV